MAYPHKVIEPLTESEREVGALRTPNPVALCQMWIRRHMQPNVHVNRRFTAYQLKHVVERWVDQTGIANNQHVYIDEEEFIAAAKALGYTAQTIWHRGPLYEFPAKHFLAGIQVRRTYTPSRP